MIKRIIVKQIAIAVVLFSILIACDDDKDPVELVDNTADRKTVNEDWKICLPGLDTLWEEIDTMKVTEIQGKLSVELEWLFKRALGLSGSFEVSGKKMDSKNYRLRRENLMNEDFRKKYQGFRLCYCESLRAIPESCKADSIAFYKHRLTVYNSCFENYQKLPTDFCDPKPEVSQGGDKPLPIRPRKKQPLTKKETMSVQLSGRLMAKKTGQRLANVPIMMDDQVVVNTNNTGHFDWQKEVPRDTIFSASLSIQETDDYHAYDTLIQFYEQGLNLSIRLKEKTKFKYRVVYEGAKFIKVGSAIQAFSSLDRVDLRLPAGRYELLFLDEQRQVFSSTVVDLPNQHQKIIIDDKDYHLQPFRGPTN